MKTHGELEKLGEEMKAVRQMKGLSLGAVASPAKISPTYLQKLEKGVVRNPSPRVLHRVGRVLGLSYVRMMELAGYFMPGMEDGGGGGKPRNSLIGHALEVEDLTGQEWKAVAAFVGYLKGQREK